MAKSKQKYLFRVIAIIIIFISIVVLSYYNIKPSASQKDIIVQGVLELNKTGVNSYKEYLLSINMTKNKDSNIAIYPYIEGLGLMAFSEEDRGEFYLPGSVGSGGVTEPIAIKELQRKNV